MRHWMIWMAAAVVTVGVCAQPPVLPHYAVEDDLYAPFGSDRNVELVAALLKDTDYSVRETAVADLGDMRNFKGIAHIRQSAKDDQALVRAAAALAASRFPAEKSGDIVLALLQDKDSSVVLCALRSVRNMRLPASAGEVVKLLGKDSATIKAEALATLTAIQHPLDTKTLEGLLESPSAIVRQRALEHLALLAESAVPKNKLPALAKTGPAPVRALALAAIGKYDFAPSQSLVAAAAGDSDPQIRLGAVQAYHAAGQSAKIKPFIDDSSEMVRLAAIRAAGALKVADCAAPLIVRLLDAPMGELEAVDSHIAARDSLIAIGTPEVAKLAAAEFPKLVKEFDRLGEAVRNGQAEVQRLAKGGKAEDYPRMEALAAEVTRTDNLRLQAARNIRACCRILGALKSGLVLDEQITFLDRQPTDSRVLTDLIWSLGEIGDPKALPVVESYTGRCVKIAREYLAAQLAMPPPYVPYDREATAQCLPALQKLRSKQLLPQAHAMALMKVQSLRLDRPVEEAIKVYAAAYPTASDGEKQVMAANVTTIIGDVQYMRLYRSNAMKLAAGWKLQAAVKPMEKLLTDERPGRTVMQIAAWALYQVDGKERPVGDPVPTVGNWVVVESK